MHSVLINYGEYWDLALWSMEGTMDRCYSKLILAGELQLAIF